MQTDEAVKMAARITKAIDAGYSQADVAKLLECNPGVGNRVSIPKDAIWQDAEIMDQCTLAVGNDIQSGPILCGKPADKRFVIGDRVVCLCSSCFNKWKRPRYW